jgi:hypothetical protein
VDLYQDTHINGRTKIVGECEQCAKKNILTKNIGS